jgi:hypothetical protein
MATVRCL